MILVLTLIFIDAPYLYIYLRTWEHVLPMRSITAARRAFKFFSAVVETIPLGSHRAVFFI